MTYAHEPAADRTLTVAAVSVVATLAAPIVAALAVPSAAPVLVPVAIILPFISMTVVEGSLIRNRKQA